MASRKEAKRVDSVLKGLVKRHRLAPGLAYGRIALRWPEFVGQRVAEHTAPRQYRDGLLVVHVSDSAWLNELTFLKEELVARLKRTIVDVTIKDVRFVIGPVSRGRGGVQAYVKTNSSKATNSGTTTNSGAGGRFERETPSDEAVKSASQQADRELPLIGDDELRRCILTARQTQLCKKGYKP